MTEGEGFPVFIGSWSDSCLFYPTSVLPAGFRLERFLRKKRKCNLHTMSSFAHVIKKRTADHWLVVQNIPVAGGGSTNGDIVFQGPGTVEIARIVRQCFHSFHALPPTNQSKIYDVHTVLGFSTYEAMVENTHRLDLWKDDFGMIYGSTALGQSSPHFVLRVNIVPMASMMELAGWEQHAWDLIRSNFRNAERFEV